MLLEKLKFLKPLIGRWNKEVFGKVEEIKKATLKMIVHWDDIENQRVVCKMSWRLRSRLSRNSIYLEISWR